MKKGLLKEFLDKKVIEFENINFIKNDPIQIPHRFVKKKDIEISAFLTAIFVESTLTKILYLYSKSVMPIAFDLPPCNLTM